MVKARVSQEIWFWSPTPLGPLSRSSRIWWTGETLIAWKPSRDRFWSATTVWSQPLPLGRNLRWQRKSPNELTTRFFFFKCGGFSHENDGNRGCDSIELRIDAMFFFGRMWGYTIQYIWDGYSYNSMIENHGTPTHNDGVRWGNWIESLNNKPRKIVVCESLHGMNHDRFLWSLVWLTCGYGLWQRVPHGRTSHEISYNTINPSHTQMLVPRQIPPFYGSMIIMIDWIWLWDPTSIPFPEKGIHIVCSPRLWLRAFSFFVWLRLGTDFFWIRMIYPYIPTFFAPNHWTHWNQPVGTPKYAWFPSLFAISLWPYDIPWPTVRSGASWRARTASGLCRPKLWNSHRMGPPPCSSAA